MEFMDFRHSHISLDRVRTLSPVGERLLGRGVSSTRPSWRAPCSSPWDQAAHGPASSWPHLRVQGDLREAALKGAHLRGENGFNLLLRGYRAPPRPSSFGHLMSEIGASAFDAATAGDQGGRTGVPTG